MHKVEEPLKGDEVNIEQLAIQNQLLQLWDWLQY